MMSYTGIGAAFLKKEWIKSLSPIFSGGGAIKDVTTEGCFFPNTYEKFEAGTPDIIGAVSLLRAFEYIESIGGYEVIEKHEQELVDYAMDEFTKIQDKVKLLGSYSKENRIGVFSFYLPEQMNFNLVGEYFSKHNICIRCGGHCAYPLHREKKIS
jgi:cysteine desulfurase/selenocysteine lyase